MTDSERRCTCTGCGHHDGRCITVRSSHNANQMCWPCIDYSLAHSAKLPVVPAPHRGSYRPRAKVYRPRVSGKRHKPQAKQIDDYQAVLNALKTMIKQWETVKKTQEGAA